MYVAFKWKKNIYEKFVAHLKNDHASVFEDNSIRNYFAIILNIKMGLNCLELTNVQHVPGKK